MAGILLVATFAASLFLFRMVWGDFAFPEHPRWGLVVLIVVASVIVHEALHVLGWRLASGVSWKSIALRPTWRKFGIEARLTVPIRASHYRVGLALPIVILGVVPMVLALLFGHGMILLWSQFFLLECYADMTKLLASPKESDSPRA